MRLLHSSDWHLGAALGRVSRRLDHRCFLDHLARVVADREVDVLVIAGDVFDHAQPSAEALQLYYRALVELRDAGLASVVIVGGNHDSPSRLDAPREVLGALGVHVVGGYEGGEAGRERMVVPLRTRSGGLGAVLAAVPFVHEYRLGIRTTGLDKDGLRAAFRERFAELYRDLADRAEAVAGSAPLLGTGHLTAGVYRAGESPLDIHGVGTIGALPSDIFDPRLRYVALGHIHRARRVGRSAAWYSGSPIPLTPGEMAEPRSMWLLDIERGFEPEAVEVPCARAIVRLQGALPAVLADLEDLEWSEPFAPLLLVRLEVDRHEPEAPGRIRELLERRFPDDGPTGRPSLVRVEQRRALGEQPSVAAGPSLRELRPDDVFRLLCARRGEAVDDALEAAFAELLGEVAGGGA